MIKRRVMYGSKHISSAFHTAVTRLQCVGLGLFLAIMPTVANAAPTQADMQTAVVTPLSFINYEDLDFGRIIPANVAGSVTISTNNVRTATNGIILVGTDYQVARFAGRGVQNQRVRIRIAPDTLTLTGPGPAMTVNNFIIGPGASLQQVGGSPNYRIVPTNGIFTFTVGGRLNIGANQTAGSYTGAFTATLDYQ